ncbi:long-chain fatty acid transport protein [Rubritalea squalenifaciens DSM 18772]|uniref:Long-chain fatty acid transport protein n=1 Tax=Rubritalea squalenifaciens DSM 18772 TaxID=1123071 RepID=A0A1M6R172_9BACT|nr:outer membrane protein transport protein [Rubritalea squalenifaciens]SHK26118.1 long-chain fatty acid transport protein [Rubritalea squalenifaciens DSM 18772]
MSHPRYLAPVAITFLAVHSAHSAGFALQERSTSGLGRAFSGEAAIGDDATAIASNPAIMTLLGDNAVSAGLAFISPDLTVKGRINGVVPANDGGPGQHAFVPHLYATHKFNEEWAVGLALHSRFGLSTDYGNSFAAGAVADNSEIKTIYISPKLSYKATDRLSLGVGFDAVYADGELTNQVNGAKLLGLQGDDWGYGFNIGLLYEFSDKTRIGLAYHSSIDLKLDGDASSDTGFPLLIPPGGKSDATLEAELPDSIEFSVYHEINNCWAIHGDILWTRWSTFDELAPQTDDFGPLPVTPENWKDTFRLAVGATYKHNDKWTFRAGAAFDESPVRNAEDRTLRIPDSDRYWLSTGATYQINDCYSVDLAFTYIFSEKVKIVEALGPGATFEGTSEGDVSILGISVNGKF